MPEYQTKPGTIDMSRWEFLPKAQEMRASRATNKLFVGGTGSGKSSNALMIGILDYSLRWEGCDILCIRRTFSDLDKGLIADFKNYVPKELYKYNESKHIATFFNGSKVYFGHLATGNEKDLHQYLSASFCMILLDECAQFSLDSWQFLKSRNRVNPGCKPNTDGKLPVPSMIGCTNPVGQFWPEYKRVFVDGEPFEIIEGSKKDRKGVWWKNEGSPEHPEWRCIRDPRDFKFVHSTVFDNPHMLARDPQIFSRLNSLSSDMRDRLLYGAMDGTVGQYFDNFSVDRHVINLRRDPEAIKWQDYQPKWMSTDWGRVHHCATYWFTKALVRTLDGTYRLKTVCYRELVVQGKTGEQLADLIAKMSVDRSGKREKISAYYFSHERFAKQMEAHSPADEYSHLLMSRGLPAVSRGTTDRVGRASLTYNLLSSGDLVFLDTCPDIIVALPNLIRDEDNLEDVKQIDSKSDDCFAAGTLIETFSGPRPIETIQVGDLVLTRAGYKPITRTLSREANTISIEGLWTCTPDHKVWTPTGWKPAKDVAGNTVWKLSATAAPTGAATQTLNTCTSAVITNARIGQTGNSSFTEKYGWTQRVKRFLPDMISTIKTITSTIMTLRIWSRYRTQSIAAITARRGLTTLITGIRSFNTWLISALLQVNGTAQKRDGDGIASMPLASTRIQRFTHRSALTVSKHLGRVEAVLSTALTVVCSNTTDETVVTTLRSFVSDARNLLSATNTIKAASVPSHVAVKPTGKQKVYDLTVADVHEFFANGILVSNCYDACTLGIFGYLHTRKKPKEVQDQERIAALEDPFAKQVAAMALAMAALKKREAPPTEQWMYRLPNHR